MATELTLSTVTGASKRRCGVREADTTTSWPITAAGTKLIVIGEVELTEISCVSYPTDVITSVTGSDGTGKVKRPVSSVVVPAVPSFTFTETFATFSPVAVEVMRPDTDTFCAHEVIEKRSTVSHTADKRMLSLIVMKFCLESPLRQSLVV